VLAALFWVAALLVAWPASRRTGTWAALSGLALAAAVLPYAVLSWTSETAWSGWEFLGRESPGWCAWLFLPPFGADVGVGIQATLVLVALAAPAAAVRSDPHDGRFAVG